MNKIVTLCDKRYFEYGTMFLNTRERIKADVVCYSPDMNDKQIDILNSYDIEHKHIDKDIFEQRMQFSKFWCVERETVNNDNSLITFCDWDTFFIQDWSHEIDFNIGLGVTYRENFIKKGYLRAFANGGVIFFRDNESSKEICRIAKKTMLDGDNLDLPEYDEIWKTLESKDRPAHKRHKRTNLRWWVDQVFLSAMVLRCRRGLVPNEIMGDCCTKLSNAQLTFGGCDIRFYDCKQFNHVESKPTMVIDKNIYIRHLKNYSGASGSLKDGK